jgi:hypothetical protein
MNMKHPCAPSAATLLLLLAACHSGTGPDSMGEGAAVGTTHETMHHPQELEFRVARNYFVRNTVTELADPRITTAEEFSTIFGMATTMGADGTPTEVDLHREFVIAIILPETNVATEVVPVRLEKDGNGGLTLSYRRSIGAEQTFTTRPFAAIIVDKAESGTVTLKEVE